MYAYMFKSWVSLDSEFTFAFIRASDSSYAWPEMEFCLNIQKQMPSSPRKANQSIHRNFRQTLYKLADSKQQD